MNDRVFGEISPPKDRTWPLFLVAVALVMLGLGVSAWAFQQ